MKPIKFRRVYPGYYTANATTTLNGKPQEIDVEIRRFDEWTGAHKWSVQYSYREVDGWYNVISDYADSYGPETYREARDCAALTVARGFRTVEGLGWCAA